MNQYDALNVYLHALHGNYHVFIYRTFENKKHVIAMQAFLKQHQISLPFIEHFNEEDDLLIQQCSRIKDILILEDILGTDCLKQLESLINDDYHIVFVAGQEQCEQNKNFISEDFVMQYKRKNHYLYYNNKQLKRNELSFNGPFDYFMTALYQLDKWPGLLVFRKEQHIFIPTQTKKQVDQVFSMISNNTIFDAKIDCNEDMYMVHLSDLHLGPRSKNKGLSTLEQSLDNLHHKLQSNYKTQFLITGDLMNSPNRKNMYQATSFIARLKRVYKGHVCYVLGNHDVLMHGLNLFRRQKAKVVGYLLGSHLSIFENEKIIYIKINSTLQGNLARGKIGKQQLASLSQELSLVDNLEDYTLIALVHHHVLEIPKDAFLKTKWHERMFIGRWVENSKVLLDASDLLQWLDDHKVQYILHGHRHLPFFNYKNKLYVISGGSSCGGGANERNSRYLSYNLIKYDVDSQQMKYCFICYDDTTNLERQRVKVHLFQDEFYEVNS